MWIISAFWELLTPPRPPTQFSIIHELNSFTNTKKSRKEIHFLFLMIRHLE